MSLSLFAATPVLYDHGNNTGTSFPNRGNGNIADDGTRLYAYDALNRLSREADQRHRTVAAYTYDALGRRIRKDHQRRRDRTVANGTSATCTMATRSLRN